MRLQPLHKPERTGLGYPKAPDGDGVTVGTVYVCRKCKHSKDLQKAIERGSDATVKLVGCQDVCRQPVAGTRIDERLEWFGGLDKPARRAALIALLNDERPRRIPRALDKARVPKRSGKDPR
jgi:hypothetical protein